MGLADRGVEVSVKRLIALGVVSAFLTAYGCAYMFAKAERH